MNEENKDIPEKASKPEDINPDNSSSDQSGSEQEPKVEGAQSEQAPAKPAETQEPTPVKPPSPAVDISQKQIHRPGDEEKGADGQPTVLDEKVDRRDFIKWLTVGWAAFAAILGGYGTLILRYLFPNVLFEPKQSFRAGQIDDYIVGDVSERFKESFGVWIVRDSEKIYALSTVCTHLGCTPNWLPGESKYKCPCHGSGFYKTGINFEGPAPRPLERYKISLSDDGEIIVDKTKKFQQEKGEWNDAESYITA